MDTIPPAGTQVIVTMDGEEDSPSPNDNLPMRLYYNGFVPGMRAVVDYYPQYPVYPLNFRVKFEDGTRKWVRPAQVALAAEEMNLEEV